jgi:3-hydroxyacyl-CoA dehydrogenase/enoyl-CoA hydratase/3-hydroxybutyryl-CoA epimerase
VNAFHFELEEDGLGVLTFDLPGEKVNKLSRVVLEELEGLLARLAADARIRCLLLRSGKPDVFIAGADVKEFVTARAEDAREGSERGQQVIGRIADLPFATVAAIGGVCLGGGAEIALACDWRLMSDSKKSVIGFPEVRLGIFPAWGGTSRLPRVVGLRAAMDMILTGRSLDARRARKIGLVDEAVPAAIFEDWCRSFARGKVGTGKRRVRRSLSLSDLALEGNPLGRRLLFSQARERTLKQTGGNYPAPIEALSVLEESAGKPLPEALAIEAAHIGNVFGGEVQRNLLAIFLLTEEVKKETGVDDPAVAARPVTALGVLGAGVMGGGIAQLAADKDLASRMKDIAPQALAHGYQAAAAVWRESVKKGRLSPKDMRRKMLRISGGLDYAGFSRCEVTVEAVVEKLAVKRQVLQEWEAAVPDGAIFASNTSTIPITQIAAAARRPQRVCGMHFFNPVHRMPLVEVIRGEKTSDETVATVFALAKALGKTPVVVQDAPGFLVNRILANYLAEGVRLVHEGCAIDAVDGVMTRFGMPVGPLALLDDVGLDVAAKAAEVLAPAFPSRMSAEAGEELFREGRLGRKVGKGFYDYDGSSRRGPSPEAYRILGTQPKDPPPMTDADIEDRLLLPMINEAAFCLEDGVVREPGKLDLAMIFGTGFPPFRGGLLRCADALGLPFVHARLTELAARHGTRFTPAGLIRQLAERRQTFYEVAP